MSNRRSSRASSAFAALRWWVCLCLLSCAALVLAADLRVIDLQPAGTNNTWRLRWNSIPGTEYQVQRAKDDQLNAAGTNGWLPVLTVRATNTITTAEDSGGANLRQRFYRVVQLARDLSLRILDLKLVGSTNVWRLRWNSVPGTDYQVQRAKDDQLQSVLTNGWVPVLSVRASGDVTSADDAAGAGVRQRFYRVVQLTNEQSLVVSPIDPGGIGGGGSGGTTLRIVTGGTQTVSSVVFLDQGNIINDATPGIDGSWSLNLPGAATEPRIRQITARVTTVEGTVVDTPAVSFLEADTSKFVPVNEDGSPGYGSFVSVEADGTLGRFLFYPEGLGDAARSTGAHFEFPAGSTLKTLIGSVGLEFSSTRFFRGHTDPSPIEASGGTHTLDFAGVSAEDVSDALGLNSSVPLSLLWNGLPLEWRDGALGENGWASLFVRPPFGDFLLPDTQECALVSFDTRTGDPTLIVCYHGDWAPFQSGPQFRIPRAEPLKIYLSWSGKLAAHGTVEATFPDGATLRGSVAWREPNFEVRFQGRNIVIPALASLKRALPSNPELCLPAGNSTAELDAAAQCLTSIRDTYRALAMGGVAEVGLTSGDALAPLGEPVDSVGVALGAWASRLASWAADRAGQTLDAEMVTDLQKVVLNAAKTGESAHDLPSVLKLLRDVMVLRQHRDAPVGGGSAADELRARIDEAESRLLAAAERVIEGTGGFEASAEFAEIVRLLGSATAVESPAGAGLRAAGGGSTRLQQVINAAKAKIGPKFAGRVSLAANNLGFGGFSARDCLSFLEELVVYHELLTFSGSSVPAGAPTPAQVIQATQNLRAKFEDVHSVATAEALTSRDYLKLRAAVSDRAGFFNLFLRLDAPLPSDLAGFTPNTRALMDGFADVLETMPDRSRARYCAEDFAMLDRIASSTTDGGANSGSLDRALALVSSCADLLVASSGAARQCDDLVQALLGAEFTVAPRDPAQEAEAFPDISGRYETAENGTEFYVTLQINQGGRYFKGRMQSHTARRSDRTLERYQTRTIEGWFLRQTSQPGTMEFACRSTDPAGGEPVFLRGTARREAGGATSLTINGQAFLQISDRPVFAEAIINAFERQQRDSVRAANESPMHHRILSRVAERARALRLIIERYYSDAAGESQERTEAGNLNNALDEIRRMVSVDQRPLARMTVRQVLSSSTVSVLKSKVARIQLIGGRIDRSHWELALGMALEYPILVNQASEMLGTAPAAIRSVDQFRYRITVQQKSFPLKAIFGASELDVTIEKFRPDTTKEATFHYDGFITTAGLSAGGGVTISDSTVEVLSPFNYAAADFNGELHYTQLGAGFAFFDVGLSGGVGLLEINGSGRFPAMVLNISSVSGQFGLAAQIGWDVGVGLMVDEGNAPAPGASLVFDDVVRFDATAEGRFDQAVFFGVDSDVISPCGLQFLREFVAEYRSMFEAPKSFIEIRGFTDRTASAAYNLDLSQRRAGNVRAALLAFVGTDLRIAPENISAEGLGEAPAAAAGVPDAPSPSAIDAAWRRVDIVVGGKILATIPTPPGRAP